MPLFERPLEELGSSYKSVSKYYAGAVNESEVTTILSALAASESLMEVGRVCVLFGNGARPKSAYVQLRSVPGAAVLWDGPLLPRWAFPLAWIVGAHAGLVRISQADALIPAFENLSTLAMADL